MRVCVLLLFAAELFDKSGTLATVGTIAVVPDEACNACCEWQNACDVLRYAGTKQTEVILKH